jgi:DNA-binding phage protein
VPQNRHRGPPTRVLEPKDIITLFRAEVQKTGSITAWAKKTSVQRADVSRVLHNKKPLSKKMLRALGLRKALSSTSDSRVLETREIGRLVRTQVAQAGSQSAWARDTGIQRSEINRVLRGKRPPNKQMVHALGLRVVIVKD